MEYIIVHERLSDLEFHVNKKLQEGYKLQGGVSTMGFEGNLQEGYKQIWK
jgi:hypothetical protein